MNENIKTSGFSLVELLAVLVIIAIIATITMPIVTNVFQNAKSNAFEDDAMSLYKAAGNYYTSATLDSSTKLPLLVTFTNKQETNKYLNNSNHTCETSTNRLLEYSGQNPDSGNIFIGKNGDIYIALYNKSAKKCAIKKPGDKTVTFTDTKESECKLDNVPC